MRNIVFTLILAMVLAPVSPVLAGDPGGTNWFQMYTLTQTGSDNTGDGGTGLDADLNYYYVGQSFNTRVDISIDAANPSNGADFMLDYDPDKVSASGLTTLTAYQSWVGESIDNVTGHLEFSAYNNPGTYYSGTRQYGRVTWTMLEPTAAAYGYTPSSLDIDYTNGVPTDTNVARDGIDYMDSEEDFDFHVWADTLKPYAQDETPTDGAVGVDIDDDYYFELWDSLNGEGDDSGAGTGVDTTVPPGAITFDDGGGAVDYTGDASYACSGIFGTNECDVTVDPDSPSGIAGDQRNWEYDTSYTVEVSGYTDLASAAQDQLGDANGPNTMDTKTWTFSTEADNVPPEVTSESPARGSSGNAVDTNLVITVLDLQTYPGNVSGTGVVSTTCDIDVSSPSFPLETYTEGHADVAVATVDYGYRFTINPVSDFAQNETVSVSVYNCEDVIGNTMVADNYTFTTTDSDAPYVDTRNPADDAGIAVDGTIEFNLNDDGVGIDLDEVVVYVNGTYYTNGGGAGQVTVSGTRITFASSLDFTAASYVGDTTSLINISAPNIYQFIIDPEVDFTAGEAVPVLIYAADSSGNLMERDVYALNVGGGTGQICGNAVIEGNEVCDDGNTASGDGCSSNCLSEEVCGNYLVELSEECDDGNTSDGDGCDSTCDYEPATAPACNEGGGGGIEVFTPSINISTVEAVQIDADSVLITWLSNLTGSGRVVYDDMHHGTLGSAPNYGYPLSSQEYDDNSTYHSVIIDGLEMGTVYYFRPITRARGLDAVGPQVLMVPVYGAEEGMVCTPQIVTETQEVVREVPVTETITNTVTETVYETVAPVTQYVESESNLQFIEIRKTEESIQFFGKADPLQTLRLIIY